MSIDKKIFKEIEQARKEIIDADIELEIIDYGARSPNLSLTKEDMYRGRVVKSSTKNMCAIGVKNKWSEKLYYLVKEYKPNTILELGTCCGFSSIYMSKANPLAKIYTLEGSPALAKIAEKNFTKLNCKNIEIIVGRFQDNLLKILQNLEVVDFAFIDGHHDKDATLEYFSKIKPFLNKDAIVVLDDISWSNGMKEAWDIIKVDKDLSHVEDLGKFGICYFKENS